MSQCFRLFEVKRHGYYKTRHRIKQDDTALIVAIKACFNQHKQSYGRRRLRIALQQDYQIRMGHRRLSKLMKIHGLQTVWRGKRFRYAAKVSECSPYPNVLNRQFKCASANQSWVSDMTYIRTLSGWYYLAAVLDLYSRKIVGFAMGRSATAELACQALQMAIDVRRPPRGLIIHSDQGCQYTSQLYQQLVAKYQFTGSMSRRGNCWESEYYPDAVMERFFRNLKQEHVWRHSYANHMEAQQSISSYILDVYNSTRLHSTLNYLSPNAFEAKMSDTQHSNKVVT
jgi:putative transposase